MIIGTGIDIIEIERIAKAMENPSFLERIFTKKERRYFSYRKYNISTISGSFAAKEAMAKALGTGIGKISWHDIEILRHNGGKPYIQLHGNADEVFRSLGGMRIHVTISHSRLYAISQIIIEGE